MCPDSLSSPKFKAHQSCFVGTELLTSEYGYLAMDFGPSSLQLPQSSDVPAGQLPFKGGLPLDLQEAKHLPRNETPAQEIFLADAPSPGDHLEALSDRWILPGLLVRVVHEAPGKGKPASWDDAQGRLPLQSSGEGETHPRDGGSPLAPFA